MSYIYKYKSYIYISHIYIYMYVYIYIYIFTLNPFFEMSPRCHKKTRHLFKVSDISNLANLQRSIVNKK